MFSRFVSDRLNAGKGALDLATIEKLSSIKDKEFATQQELDNWFAENGVESDVRNKIAARIPTAVAVGNDVVFCLDAGDGKTLWKATFPGAPQPHAASSTPCVIGGRCYVIGSDSDCRCLDAGTGALIWQKKVGKGANNASFMVIDGVAIIPAGPLAGIDALTGNLRWSHDKIGAGNASPVPWISGGRTNAIVRAGRALTCLDPRTGSILWTVSDSAGGDFAGATPAVEGDIMAVSCNDSVAIYRLAPDKAALLGNVKCPMDYSSSPIVVNGHAYVFGRNGSACISIEKASLVWENKELKAGSYLAPVAADGKVFTQGHGTGYGSGDLVMLAVSPDGGRQMASAPIKQVLCTTPALADGRAYCRLNSGVACYDLRTTAMAGSATAH
jgi:outer membrane protein assembly factor BamB